MNDLIVVELRPAHGNKKVAFAMLESERTLNSLTLHMVKQLKHHLDRWLLDPSVACVVLYGAGTRALCAGGDVVRVYRSLTDGEGCALDYAEKFFRHEYELDYTIHTYSKPIVCWGSGIVMGGGLGLMVGASHRIVTESSLLAMPEISIGLYPDVGASWFLNRMPGKIGLFVGLTGARLNAHDGCLLNLADYILSNDSRGQIFDELLELAWTDDPQHNRARLSSYLNGRKEMAVSGKSNVCKHLDLILESTGFDTVEEIVDALDQHCSSSTWLAECTKTLKSGSPTSAKVIMEIYRRARFLSLQDVYHIGLGCLCAEARSWDAF